MEFTNLLKKYKSSIKTQNFKRAINPLRYNKITYDLLKDAFLLIEKKVLLQNRKFLNVLYDAFLKKYSTFKYAEGKLAHATNSQALKSILKERALIPDIKGEFGEASTDLILEPRKFVSFYRWAHPLAEYSSYQYARWCSNSNITAHLLTINADKINKTIFLDEFFPLYWTLSDAATIQKRIKKMLKFEPKIVTEEHKRQTEEIYKRIYTNRRHYKTLKSEKLTLKAIKDLVKHFGKNILPQAEFDKIKTSDPAIIMRGLNIYTGVNLKEKKYQILRMIYLYAKGRGLLTNRELNNFAVYKKKISKVATKLLIGKGGLLHKLMCPLEGDSKAKAVKKIKKLRDLESQYPVIILVEDLDTSYDYKIQKHPEHMPLEYRSKKKVGIEKFCELRVPFKKMKDVRKWIPKKFRKKIDLIPWEIFEVKRVVSGLID